MTLAGAIGTAAHLSDRMMMAGPATGAAWKPNPVRGFTASDYRIPADPLGVLRRRSAKDPRPVPRIRRLFLEQTYGQLTVAERARVNAFWYRKAVLAQSTRELARHGGEVARSHGVRGDVQRRQMIKLAVGWAVPPIAYYRYGLYRPERRSWRDQLLMRYQLKGFAYNFLHDALEVKRRAPVTDKRAFAARCVAAGLPHVPVCASFDAGEVSWLTDRPAGDLFVKPLALRGGTGAAAWVRNGDGTFSSLDGSDRLTERSLVDHYAQASRKVPYILSPRVANHPDLADIAIDTLSTARVMTVLDEGGVPEVVAAVLRMPTRGHAAVDNGHQGGMMAPVDLSTGRMGAATTLDPASFGRVSRHPVSGAPVEGRVLPMWDAVVDLARRAQTVFEPRVTVGWDIAITAEGPTLVEGNSKPDTDIMQVAHGPLGNGRWGQLLALHLDRRAAA